MSGEGDESLIQHMNKFLFHIPPAGEAEGTNDFQRAWNVLLEDKKIACVGLMSGKSILCESGVAPSVNTSSNKAHCAQWALLEDAD